MRAKFPKVLVCMRVLLTTSIIRRDSLLILIVGGYGFGFRSIMALHPCRGLSFPSKSPNSVESVVLAGGMTNTPARSVDGSRESLLVVPMNYGVVTRMPVRG